MNVTYKKLESKFPGEGAARFREIAELGGFGTVTASSAGAEGGIDMHSENGLDLTGVLAPENKALTDAKKDKIRERAGIDSESAESKSSADKMKGKEK